MPRVEDQVELIIDLSDEDSDAEDESGVREPARLKQWFQSGTRGPRPIAGNKRVNSSNSVGSSGSGTSSFSSSPVQTPSSETGASGTVKAADLHGSKDKAFTEAWATATPFFNPKVVEFGPEALSSNVDNTPNSTT